MRSNAGKANRQGDVSSKGLLLVHIIKKDRFKMAAGVGLSTSLSDYFVRKDCI